MKKVLVGLAALALLASSAAVWAADHPDSKTQSIEDGCNRTQLGLLGEAALTMEGGPHVTAFASWVYVNGDNKPVTLEGTTLGTHTAGTDLFGVHKTYDLNIDVKPDPTFDHLLSTRNTEEKPPQIHTEWEAGLAPLFAWPSVGDRVRETGSEIWDCGHFQGDGARQVPNSDLLPGDPLGAAGVEKVGGESIEVHPMFELATWRAHGDFVPRQASTPVHASQLDVAISNQGGLAKAVEECALLAPKHPGAVAGRLVAGMGCSTLQDVTGRDYVYELRPPGSPPSSRSVLRFQQDLRYVHNGPRPSAVRAKVVGDRVRVTVPFSHVRRSSQLQDLGGTWHAWWSDDPTPTRAFRVTLQSIAINNNLDVDSDDTNGNPSITPEGEWNMFAEIGGNWINLHDPRPGQLDYIPALGAVPSAKAKPQVLSTASVQPRTVVLHAGQSLHLFTDARECDQPGYVDCPTKNELATTGRSAGRVELSLPVDKLAGRSTVATVHPPVCGPKEPCPEDRNSHDLCPDGCYDVTFRIDDVTGAVPGATGGTSASVPPVMVRGDGTVAATTVDGQPAAALPWWIGPVTRYGPDQGEENATIAAVLGRLLALRSP